MVLVLPPYLGTATDDSFDQLNNVRGYRLQRHFHSLYKLPSQKETVDLHHLHFCWKLIEASIASMEAWKLP